MRTRSVFMIFSLTLLLTACGGKKLSFKNSDEVIKSYKSVTENLTETDRLKFRRNMFLVAWTAEKAEADISLSDLQTAWEYERNTLDLTGPEATPLAKDLALRGVSKLDGKTVAQVNTLGENLSAIAVDAEVKSVEEKIVSLDATIEKLKADKEAWKVRHQEAIAAEAALVEETKKYKPTIKSKKLGKNWQGPTLEGQISMASPYADPINDFKNTFRIEHNGHVALANVRGQFTRYKKESFFTIGLSPRGFTNEQGDKFPKDYTLPQDISAYDISFRPNHIRTSGSNEGWKTYEYNLDANMTKALYNLPRALEACDKSIETAEKIRTSFEAQIETLKAKKIDDLKSVYGRYAESCL